MCTSQPTARNCNSQSLTCIAVRVHDIYNLARLVYQYIMPKIQIHDWWMISYVHHKLMYVCIYKCDLFNKGSIRARAGTCNLWYLCFPIPEQICYVLSLEGQRKDSNIRIQSLDGERMRSTPRSVFSRLAPATASSHTKILHRSRNGIQGHNCQTRLICKVAIKPVCVYTADMWCTDVVVPSGKGPAYSGPIHWGLFITGPLR